MVKEKKKGILRQDTNSSDLHLMFDQKDEYVFFVGLLLLLRIIIIDLMLMEKAKRFSLTPTPNSFSLPLSLSRCVTSSDH